MKIENPNVHFSTTKSAFDNAITNWYELAWTDLTEMLLKQGHVVTENKDVTLISPWQYKTTNDDFLPALTGDGQLRVFDGKPAVGRLAANVTGTDMLMFDFDGSITITEAMNVFSAYTHLGYTSYSHMSPKKDGKDCFRVIVPLAQFVTSEQLVERREAIYGSIQGVDKSCLSLARSFYVPSCYPTRKHLAQIWDNHGELFDVMDYQPNVYMSPVASATVVRPIDKSRIIEALKQVYIGNEPEWYSVACVFASNDFTFQDFVEVSVGHLMKEKTVKDCEKKWKSALRSVERGRTSNVGYLVNLCKRHNAWKTSTEHKVDTLKATAQMLRSAS